MDSDCVDSITAVWIICYIILFSLCHTYINHHITKQTPNILHFYFFYFCLFHVSTFTPKWLFWRMLVHMISKNYLSSYLAPLTVIPILLITASCCQYMFQLNWFCCFVFMYVSAGPLGVFDSSWISLLAHPLSISHLFDWIRDITCQFGSIAWVSLHDRPSNVDRSHEVFV